jgi:hypothetical protein
MRLYGHILRIRENSKLCLEYERKWKTPNRETEIKVGLTD